MSEKILVKRVKNKLAGTVGGFWVKIHGGLFQMTGLPDLIGCVQGRFIGIEVKMPGKLHKVTERQQYILDLISAAGGLAFATDTVADAVKRVRQWLRGVSRE